MRTGLILMTALPPTVGHLALIRFARAYMESVGGRLVTVMCEAPGEPGQRGLMFEALRTDSGHASYVFGEHRMRHRYAPDPQEPSGPDDAAFWAHWREVCVRECGSVVPEFVFSSEEYGSRLAEELGAQHVPFDVARTLTAARATSVRHAPISHWGSIAPSYRRTLRRRVTLFGQESVGKTSVARSLQSMMGLPVTDEWARPYLEALPSPEVTQQRMMTILRAQVALERTAWATTDAPILVHDTDALSTLGYQMHWCGKGSADYQELLDEYERLATPSHLYLVLPDHHPMTPDPLRYGGDVRETTRDFWISLLESRGYNYLVLEPGDVGELTAQAFRASRELFEQGAAWCRYERKRS